MKKYIFPLLFFACISNQSFTMSNGIVINDGMTPEETNQAYATLHKANAGDCVKIENNRYRITQKQINKENWTNAYLEPLEATNTTYLIANYTKNRDGIFFDYEKPSKEEFKDENNPLNRSVGDIFLIKNKPYTITDKNRIRTVYEHKNFFGTHIFMQLTGPCSRPNVFLPCGYILDFNRCALSALSALSVAASSAWIINKYI